MFLSLRAHRFTLQGRVAHDFLLHFEELWLRHLANVYSGTPSRPGSLKRRNSGKKRAESLKDIVKHEDALTFVEIDDDDFDLEENPDDCAINSWNVVVLKANSPLCHTSG